MKIDLECVDNEDFKVVVTAENNTESTYIDTNLKQRSDMVRNWLLDQYHKDLLKTKADYITRLNEQIEALIVSACRKYEQSNKDTFRENYVIREVFQVSYLDQDVCPICIQYHQNGTLIPYILLPLGLSLTIPYTLLPDGLPIRDVVQTHEFKEAVRVCIAQGIDDILAGCDQMKTQRYTLEISPLNQQP